MIHQRSFQLQNPWRQGDFTPAKTFQRFLLKDALSWMNDPYILVIIGSRQVGKTTLLSQMIEHLLANEVAADDIFYFNLDDRNLLEFFKDPADFLDLVDIHKKGRAYVFIDEVQRIENPGLFLKYIYDLKKNLKLIASGSSSLEIQAKISESLTGRKKLFHMRPFGFGEFVAAKWFEWPAIAEKLSIRERGSFFAAISRLQRLYQPALEKWLAEYMTYGGYPGVILEANEQKKIALLQEIFTSYLQKDVTDFFKIENVSGYNNLLRVLSQQIGNLVNISNLSNLLGLNQATIDKYMQLLEGTFIFKRLTPFFQNVRRELSKMPKIYALDLGMRNFAAGNFNDVLLRGDRGEMAENFVFTELERLVEAPNELHFWRTQTKAEVDFIIAFPSGLIPVEVKFTAMKAPEFTRSFNSFLSTYQPRLGVVFTKDYLGHTQVNQTEVLFLPIWALLFLKLEYLLKV